MTPKSVLLRSLFVALVVSTINIPVFAQSTASLHFLETFAMRLFARGETDQARKEFQRILSIDPNNAIARKFIAAPAPAPTTATGKMFRLNSIASDIASLRQDILSYEADANELSRTIHLIMGENDNLYIALRKRSRDLAELRAQMKNTPYYDEYIELMKALPPDRVPQQLITTQDVLPAPLDQAPSAQDEIEALTREIAEREEELSAALAAGGYDSQKIAHMDKTLEEKRSLLLEKNMLLIDKASALARIKDDVTNMNTNLKEADHRYGATLEAIERINRDFREEISTQRSTDDARYKELLADYAARVREIELFKNKVMTQPASLGEQRTILEKQDTAIARIDTAVADKDQDLQKYIRLLEEYKAELAKKDKELADKATVIAEQGDLIAEKNEILRDKDSALFIKDKAIEEKEKILSEQKNILIQKDSVISEKDAALTEKTTILVEKDALLKEAATTLATKDLALSSKEAALAEKDAVLSHKDALLKDAETTLIAKDTTITEHADTIAKQSQDLTFTNNELNTIGAQISTIEDLLLANDQDIADLKSGISRMKETIRQDRSALEKNKDLKVKLSRLERGLVALESPSLEQTSDIFAAHFRRSEEDLATAERELFKSRDNVDTLTQQVAANQLIIEKLQLENARLRDQAVPSATTTQTIPVAEQKTETILLESPKLSAEVATLHEILANKDNELVELNKKFLDKNLEARQLEAMIQAYKMEARQADALMLTQNDQVTTKLTENEKALQASRNTLQSFSLDAKEKESLIASMSQELAAKNAAMTSASEQAAILEEKLAAIMIKQEAIKAVIAQRDATITSLQTTLDNAQKGLSSHDNEKIELRAANQELSDKIAIIQSQARASSEEIARMKDEIATVRKELTNAHELLTAEKLTSARCLAQDTATKELLQK